MTRLHLILLLLALTEARADGWRQVGTLPMWGRPAGASPEVEISREDTRETIVITFPQYGIWESRQTRLNWTWIAFRGAGYSGEAGRPQYPYWTRLMPTRPEDEVFLEDMQIEWSGKEHFARLWPVAPDAPDGPSPPEPPHDEETYRRTEDVFEHVRVEIGRGSSFGGVRYRPLMFVPIGYHPAEGKVRFVKKVTLILRHTAGPPHGTEDVGVTARRRDGYMIVAPGEFLETLRPLINLKRKTHPDLVVRTLEETGSTVPEIDAAIESAERDGIAQVLLVGHSSILPGNEYDSPFDKDENPDCRDSDAVYRNVGDDVFPSVRVGRFPVTRVTELESMVAKTLRKWKSPGLNRTRPLLVAHEEGAPGKYQGCVMEIMDTLIPRAVTPLEPTLILPARQEDDGMGSTLEDLLRELRRGVGVFLYRGHGGEDFLATKALGRYGEKMEHWYRSEIPMPPVMYSIACWNGRMTDGQGERVTGLCETLCLLDGHGVCAAIGAITPSPTIANHDFAWFLMNYTYVEALPTLGEIFNRSLVETMKSGFAKTRSARQYLWVAQMYNLYGDPELPVIGP